MQLHYINNVTLNFDVELTSIKIHLPQTVSWYLWSASFVAVESAVWTWKCSDKSLQLLKMKIHCLSGWTIWWWNVWWLNKDHHFLSCFVVHFGTSSDNPWLRGRWQSAGSEKSDTEQKTAFWQNRSPPSVSYLSCQWRLETFGDVKIRETLRSWPHKCPTSCHCRKINMKRQPFHLTICVFQRAPHVLIY